MIVKCMMWLFVLLTTLQLQAVSATYSPPVDDRRIDYPNAFAPETSTGLATDWQFCRQKCLEDPTCLIFTWKSVTSGCNLYPLGFAFRGAVNFYGEGNDNVMGQLDRNNGSLMWLSLSRPIPARAGSITGSSVEECRDACDANTGLLPCSAFQLINWPDPNGCLLYAGYKEDFATNGQYEAIYKSGSFKHNSTEPTGNGTLILPENLPTAPPNVNEPPFIIKSNITASAMSPVTGWNGLVKLTSSNDHASYSDCAVACHDNANCQSFIYDGSQQCDLFDVAVQGTITIGHANYGIIDRNSIAGTLKYLVPCALELRPVPLAIHTLVRTEEDCAAKCYQFHQPIYCTSFQLDSSDYKCFLYSIELDGWKANSVSLPSSSSFSYGIIGRKPYNQHYDAGFPANQLITTTTTTSTTSTSTSTPSTTSTTTTTTAEPVPELPNAVHYNLNQQSCRLGVAPKMQLIIPITKMSPGLFCGYHCFSRRQWCRGYELSVIGRICQLFDVAVDDPATQLSQNDVGCSYGQPAKYSQRCYSELAAAKEIEEKVEKVNLIDIALHRERTKRDTWERQLLHELKQLFK